MALSPTERRRLERGGRRAERIAAFWLVLKGYRILASRARTPVGELDLVARRGRLLVFAEVKARPTLEAALSGVTPTSRRRIEQAALLWASRRTDLAGCDWRFDVIAVIPGRPPHHLRDAWRPEA
ncbi:YraN family protein [bacterium]|nr:YraN family protein [bacterium]